MKILFLHILVYLLFFTSCQSPKDSIFIAVKDDMGKSVEIEIFKDYMYKMSVNDSLLEEGQARLNGQKLILTPKPKSSLNSLVHNRVFRVVNSRLCNIIYEQKSTDTTRSTLVAPVENLDKKNCFEIKKSFIRE